MSAPVLEVRDVTVEFGGLVALDRVSFTVAPQSICGVIGPNGAGKSTLLNTLCAIYRPTRGQVTIAGRSLADATPPDVAALGVGRTFQNLRLFPTQTCAEHLAIGMHRTATQSPLGALFRTRAFRAEEQAIAARARALLAEVGLTGWEDRLATSLPYGMARRLEIARALAASPQLLLLDEPAAGLTADERAQLVALVRRLRRERNLTIVLIEHDMTLVFELCEHLVVLDHGEVIGDGLPSDVRQNPAVIAAYLGSAPP